MYKNSSRRILALILSFLLLFGLVGCGSSSNAEASDMSQPAQSATQQDQVVESIPEDSEDEQTISKQNDQNETITASVTTSGNTEPVAIVKDLKVHFIDVGQADSIFIELPTSQTMLIDAGNNDDGQLVCNYIKNAGYTKIDYIIGTHPHEDHIGGLDDVIRTYDIGSIYMPKKEHTTKTFEDVLLAIKEKGLKVNTAKAGVVLFDANNLYAEIVAPVRTDYEDLNNHSAVLYLKYGDNSFLFMGDAAKESEADIAADVKADVLKVGHHGSSTSTTPVFAKKVSPDYAVISVGKDNSYGHPDSTVLNRLKTYDALIFRTDENGTIKFTSDGQKISYDFEKYKRKEITAEEVAVVLQNINANDANSSEQDTQTITVYVTKTGSKYHRDGCRYLSKSKIPISLSDAEKSYGPCSVCSPPVLNSNTSNTSNSTLTPDKPNEAAAPQKTETQEKEITVYITKTGSKYHRSGCQYLSKSKIAISLSDAKSGYGACSKCNPPK